MLSVLSVFGSDIIACKNPPTLGVNLRRPLCHTWAEAGSRQIKSSLSHLGWGWNKVNKSPLSHLGWGWIKVNQKLKLVFSYSFWSRWCSILILPSPEVGTLGHFWFNPLFLKFPPLFHIHSPKEMLNLRSCVMLEVSLFMLTFGGTQSCCNT